MIPENGSKNHLATDWRISMTNTLQLGRARSSDLCRRLIVSALLALTISLMSCSKQEAPAATEAAQKTFAGPDDAGKALGKPPRRRIEIRYWRFSVLARKTLSTPAMQKKIRPRSKDLPLPMRS